MSSSSAIRDENIGPQKAEEFLVSIGLSNEIIDRIIYIIRHVSFKNTFDNNTEKNNELNNKVKKTHRQILTKKLNTK